MNHQTTKATIQAKFEALSPLMDERIRRRWAAAEANSLGRGGISLVAQATGLSRTTIHSGIAELRAGTGASEPWQVRRPGAGRPPLTQQDPHLLHELQALLEASTRGDPQSALLWTAKSTRNLADELVRQGHQLSHDSVSRLLEEWGYSLQANRKTREGKDHPDRDAPFEYINRRVKQFQQRGQPVVSVDTKKKELLGDFQQSGRGMAAGGLPRGSPHARLPGQDTGPWHPLRGL